MGQDRTCSGSPEDREQIERLVKDPDKAVVLSVDERSRIQALDRTQPGAADEEGLLRDDDVRL
jgi:hypothetical protein